MAKAWLSFYVGDYMADTAGLDNAAHGSYLLCLFHLWTSGESLPDPHVSVANAEQLQMICKSTSVANFENIWAKIQKYFYHDGVGYRNHRIDKELEKTSELSKKRAKAATCRYKHKDLDDSVAGDKSTAIDEQLDTQSQSQSPNDNNPSTVEEGGPSPPAKEPDESLPQKASPYPCYDSFRLAGGLADYILRNNPKNTELQGPKIRASIARWAKDFDKMLRLDKLDFETLSAVLRWCQNDSFWQNNILSGFKFREKFNELYLKWRGTTDARNHGRPAHAGAEEVKHTDALTERFCAAS